MNNKNSKKKYFIFIILIILIGVVWWFMSSQSSPVNQGQDGSSSANSDTDVYEESDVSTWPVYRNEELGFSIIHPKKSDGEPIEVIEKENVVFVTSPNPAFSEEYERVKSFDEEYIDIEDLRGMPWAIVSIPIESEDDITAFLKKRYGADCSLGELESTDTEGVYDVVVKEMMPEEGDCFINYQTVTKYSENLDRLISWSIGQDRNFIYTDENGVVQGADWPMRDSFQFIEPTATN